MSSLTLEGVSRCRWRRRGRELCQFHVATGTAAAAQVGTWGLGTCEESESKTKHEVREWLGICVEWEV